MQKTIELRLIDLSAEVKAVAGTLVISFTPIKVYFFSSGNFGDFL